MFQRQREKKTLVKNAKSDSNEMYHKKTNNRLYAQPTSTTMFSCLYDLWLSVPVNSYGDVGTLPPFYGTSTHEDVMTPKKYQLSKQLHS